MRTEWQQQELARYGTPSSPAGLARYGHGPAAPHADPFAVAAAESPPQSLWQVVDDRLRGRWRWALIAAAATGLVLAIGGWRSSGPMYESSGVIRVTPRVSVTLEAIPEIEQTQFGMFVNTQVQLIKSRRVLENAMDDGELTKLDFADHANAIGRLESGLDVATGRNSELIYVSYASESPQVAQAVVNAVIRSYYEIYGQAGGNAVGETLTRLRSVESQFQRQLQQVRSDIARIHHRYETADLLQLQAITMHRYSKLEELIGIAERNLTALTAGEQGEDIIAGDPAPLVLEHLEGMDPKLAELRLRRDEAENTLKRVKRRYRAGTAAFVRAAREYDTARQLFEDQYFAALGVWETVPETSMPGELEDVSFAGFSASRLEHKIVAMREQQDSLKRRSQDLLVDMQQLEDRRLEQEHLQVDLDRSRARIQSLELEEQNIAARITVEQEGFRPQSASSDRRRKRALMGLVSGCGLSFSVFFLWGTIDRRAFGSRQLRVGESSSDPSVLGVLPDLGPGALDVESTDVAAHCVHQIRNQIEAIRQPGEGYVLAITSPFQGDGKTSIALALGWSYAVAGYSTLVVDCDLVGCSMTRQLGLRDRPGIREALIARDPAGLVAPVRDGSLDALPVGTASGFGSESVRKVDLMKILEPLRERYDVIIMDTGPLLGSLESTPVTASADGVIMSVRRGRSRTRLEECTTRLATVGARCLGIILNCAARSECHRYVSETSVPAPPAGSLADVGPGAPGDRERRDGGSSSALVRAMELSAGRPGAAGTRAAEPITVEHSDVS